jgi:hypothetical protein
MPEELEPGGELQLNRAGRSGHKKGEPGDRLSFFR